MDSRTWNANTYIINRIYAKIQYKYDDRKNGAKFFHNSTQYPIDPDHFVRMAFSIYIYGYVVQCAARRLSIFCIKHVWIS